MGPPACTDTYKYYFSGTLCTATPAFKILYQCAIFEAMFRNRLQPYNFGFEFKLPSVLGVWLKGLDVAHYKDRKFRPSSEFRL